jgi:hypothetical protein
MKIACGTGSTSSCSPDKGLYRLSPDLIGYINRTVDQAVAARTGERKAGPAIGAGQTSGSPQ